MKIGFLNTVIKTVTSFKGRREDRNTTNQLKENNKYSLTENNQKRIDKAIQNLGKEPGENNIKFLLDVAENLQYGTNIDTGVSPKNDWKTKLKTAAENSLSVSAPIVQKKLKPEINKTFNTKKPLSADEKEILAAKDYILKNIDLSQLKDEKNTNIKNIERNLNYFLISSEIPIQQKKYILNRFQYLLSPEYKINPQLENKKTVVLAEMLNDIVVDTKDSIVPNTKAINQKQHGICAAISISRKLMSYEYKPEYVDTILSELDDQPTMMVYDLANLNKNQKVPVNKTFIDFDAALKKGYRIVDASSTQWMHIADMQGPDNEQVSTYIAFDDLNFNTFKDSHFYTNMPEKEFEKKQSYYETLLKAKEKINTAKLTLVKYNDKNTQAKLDLENNLNLIEELNSSIAIKLKKAIPSISQKELHTLVNNLLNLQVETSLKLEKTEQETKKYRFLPNEEDKAKENKIKSYLEYTYKDRINFSELNIEDIKNIMEMSSTISNSLNKSKTISQKIKEDRELFEAAAAYRTAMNFALIDDDCRTDLMIHYNIPDSEIAIINNLSNIINTPALNKNETFLYDITGENDKTKSLQILNAEKEKIEYFITQKLDELYNRLGLGNRKSNLLDEVNYNISQVQNGDKSLIDLLSTTLNTGKNKTNILIKLNEYQQILSNNPSEEDYTEIFNKMGHKSRLNAFADSFDIVSKAFEKPNEDISIEFINNLKRANAIPEDAPIEEAKKQFQMIAQEFNAISSEIDGIRDSLDIQYNNDRIFNSANTNYLIIKEMEKEGRIIPYPELKKLNERYNAIDKIRSQDEFSSRQGKISDPSLYKYTKAEKETLKKIKNRLNYMYSDVNKEINSVLKEIRKPLEEHARSNGLKSGMYWSMPEGISGLYGQQQAKILQQLTGKPYQIQENIEDAINQIKTTEHSGISSTSVFHHKPGWHAQYIAEIGEKNGKDIIFHDNTWGASEHENTWIDTEGLTRTDYSDKRGGELGYITDKQWRNGNYVKNLSEKSGKNIPENARSRMSKKLQGDREEYKFPLMSDIILPGIPEEADSIVARIRDNIFISDKSYINEFEKHASKMTIDEIRAAEIKSNTAGNFYNKELHEINQRLDKTPFNKGISTKEEIDSLSENDLVRVTFEKAALTLSCNDDINWKKLASATTIPEINKLREEYKIIARKAFDYAFAKDPKILLAYALNKNKNHIIEIIESALKNNNINTNDEQKFNIIFQTAAFVKDEKKQFDGSLKNTVNFMINKLLKQFDKQIPDSENARKAKQEIAINLRKDIEKALYFNEKDLLKARDQKLSIQKYIDKKYNPQTNKEFVQIYRKLQDMTTKEFQEETKDADNDALGIKEYSAFDILKKYTASDPQTKQTIRNLIFQKHIVKDLNLSETEPVYKYKKLYKKHTGDKYKSGRTYDDLYRSFNYSLQTLEYPKLFNKYKDENYRKYGVFPGYPKINTINENIIQEKVDMLEQSINTTIRSIHNKKLNIQGYILTEKIENILNHIPDNRKLTDREYFMINNIAGRFVTENFNDEAISTSVNAANKLLDIKKSALASEYKKAFQPWLNEINAIKTINSIEDIYKDFDDDLASLKFNMNLAISTDFPTRYQQIMKEDLKNWIDLLRSSIKTPYDQNLEFRKLETKLDKYANNSLTSSIKEDLFKDIISESEKFNKLMMNKLEINQNRKNKEEKLLQILEETIENFIPTESQNEFIDYLNNNKLTKNNYNSNLGTIINAVNKISKKNNSQPINKIIYLTKTMLKHPESIDKLQNELPKEIPSGLKQKFINNLNNYKLITNKENKLKDTINQEKELFNNRISDFTNKYIQKNYTQSVNANIVDYVKSQIKNQKQIIQQQELNEDIMYEKLLKDYRKYHILNYPQEILKRFSELCAKDGEIANAKTEEQKSELIREKNLKKDYLNSALGFSGLVEMQELIMEATQLGNPALITKKLKNYDIPLFDENDQMPQMDNAKAIDYMARFLIVEQDYDTAILFLEKLGLVERFLKAEKELIAVDTVKKVTDRIVNIINTTNTQNEIINTVTKNLIDTLGHEDYEVQIENAKKEIIAKTKKLSRQKNIEKVLATLDECKIFIQENPNLPKSKVIKEKIDTVQSEIGLKTNQDLEKNYEIIGQTKIMYEIIKKLNVRENSESEKLKTEILNKFNEILEYHHKKIEEIINKSPELEVQQYI